MAIPGATSWIVWPEQARLEILEDGSLACRLPPGSLYYDLTGHRPRRVLTAENTETIFVWPRLLPPAEDVRG